MSDRWIHVVTQLGVQHLWLSVALTLLAALVLRLQRRAGSEAHSWILLTAFALTVISPFAIFLPDNGLVASTATAWPAPKSASVQRLVSIPQSALDTADTRTRKTIFPHALATVMILTWLIGFLWKLQRLCTKWIAARRLYATARCLPDAGRRFADTEPGDVSIRVSDRISSPMVVGFARPCALLPRRLIDEMPPDILGAILRHEIAHIRRRDPWASLFQALSLAVYWWSPVLRLLGLRLDAIREMACDERAASQSGGAVPYAGALLAIASKVSASRPSHHVFAVGVLRNRATLPHRIEGLLRMDTKNRVSNKAIAAGCGLLVLSGLSLAVFATPRVGPASSLETPHASASPDGAVLIAAVNARHLDNIRRLVANGADINASVPGDGTALIVAAKRGDLDTVNTLIKLGADVNEAVHGDGNPLIAAAARGHLHVVERLIAAGAAVNAIVVDDETPLINASRSGDLQTVEYLVERGANVNLGVMADEQRWRSPLNQARTDAIRQYLIDKGATH